MFYSFLQEPLPLPVFNPSLFLKAFFWLILSFVLYKAVHKILKKQEKNISKSTFYVLQKFLRYFFFLIACIFIFQGLGFDLTLLSLFLGAVLVWVGISLQSLFHNIVCGFFLLTSRNLKVGQKVRLENQFEGIIQEIFLMNSILENEKKETLVVPNSELVTKKIMILR